MISFESAFQKVMEQSGDFGSEWVSLESSRGRVLAEAIVADRDFPPFDRATKDGIAINYDSLKSLNQSFPIEGIAQAGSPQLSLLDKSNCIEVMTGAMVPQNTDTVVMYEHLEQKNESVSIQESVRKGQNIHYKGSDIAQGEVLLQPGVKIGPPEIGVLASVGKSTVLVKKSPKIAVISTGNELVDVTEKPQPHQIRKSNIHTLQSLLGDAGIVSDSFHLKDDLDILVQKLSGILTNYDVLMLSGGVSKGKFDFLPEAFDTLGVEKVFHRVLQRPGKPFWFGKHQPSATTVFSFPGNPVSTFVGYHVYFRPWLNKTLGTASPQFNVLLKEAISNETKLTLFVGVKLSLIQGKLIAVKMATTGSGDLLALSKIDGFVRIGAKRTIQQNEEVSFIPTTSIGL